MRMSRLFSQTLREAPAEAEIASHQLLLRAGFIRQLAAGIFSYLPLARLALNKIEAILREEMNAIGGQEITMPVVHPAELWQETGRWYQIDAELGRFKDRTNRDMVLAMTHEEVVADLVRKEVRSYRQLPSLLYHIQTKFRDDPRPRAGLIRVREFTMKDSYSLDADRQGLDRQYQAHYDAYQRIYRRCGLPVLAVKSDVGMMGGQLAHEFMYLTPAGEDTLLICPDCGYSANRQIARFRKPAAAPEAPLPLEKVATPDTKTIDDLARFLDIPTSRTAKAVFLIASLSDPVKSSGQAPAPVSTLFLFVIVRGDMEANETKLANVISQRLRPVTGLRPATEDEIRAVGAEPGYASPVGLVGGELPVTPTSAAIPNVLILVDEVIPTSPNLVAGANLPGYHLKNVNYGRDYQAALVADLAAAQDGDACPECGGALTTRRGVEVGNIFKLGTRYSEALGCYFTDPEGELKPVVMGSYGIGVGRLLACIAEEHHDQQGLVWPISVAPLQVHLIVLKGKKPKGENHPPQPVSEIEQSAEELYHELSSAGIEVLLDDRDESPGIKFNDADLIGLPIRLTVSERASQQGGVEYKRRDQPEKTIFRRDEVVNQVKREIVAIQAHLNPS